MKTAFSDADRFLIERWAEALEFERGMAAVREKYEGVLKSAAEELKERDWWESDFKTYRWNTQPPARTVVARGSSGSHGTGLEHGLLCFGGAGVSLRGYFLCDSIAQDSQLRGRSRALLRPDVCCRG